MEAAIVVVTLLGAILHQLVIRPVLSAEPINQLLVTGGVLFFLQAAATLVFGIDFKNLGVTRPSLVLGEMSFSAARLIAFGAALLGRLLPGPRVGLRDRLRLLHRDDVLAAAGPVRKMSAR